MRYHFREKIEPVKVDTTICLQDSFIRQPSLVDSFYYEEFTSPVTGETTKEYHNPLYMLFNQERIDRMGPEAVRQWIDTMNNSSSQLQELRSKCTDDDLMSMVKSRHIQHPAEFERYIADLNSRADRFNSEIARVRAEMELEKQQPQEPLNPE